MLNTETGKELSTLLLSSLIYVLLGRVTGFPAIKPVPCENPQTKESGVCMFYWSCTHVAHGVHIAPCLDRFLIGSCCKLQEDGEVYSSQVIRASTTPSSQQRQNLPETSYSEISTHPVHQVLSHSLYKSQERKSSNVNRVWFPFSSESFSKKASQPKKKTTVVYFISKHNYMHGNNSGVSAYRHPTSDVSHNLRIPVILEQSHDMRKPVAVEPSHNARRPVVVEPLNNVRRPVATESSHDIKSPVSLEPMHNMRNPISYIHQKDNSDALNYTEKHNFHDTHVNQHAADTSYSEFISSTSVNDSDVFVDNDSFDTETEAVSDGKSEAAFITDLGNTADLNGSVAINTDELMLLGSFENPKKEHVTSSHSSQENKTTVFVNSEDQHTVELVTDFHPTSNFDTSFTSTSIVQLSSSVSFATPVDPTDYTTEPTHLVRQNSNKCGISPKFPVARIVGGKKASYLRWPWMISLRRLERNVYKHKCGAALLNDLWAITVAHCVARKLPSEIVLHLGDYNLYDMNEFYPHVEMRVFFIVMHPAFNPHTYENDLALLRFYHPVPNQINIAPVCLPEPSIQLHGRTATVTGWGRLSEDGELPGHLHEVHVPILTNEKCQQMYTEAGYSETIPETFVCAGHADGGLDACEGDSGGPMVIQGDHGRWFLSGIISWGIGCGAPRQPGVYTRVTKFVNWIEKFIAI